MRPSTSQLSASLCEALRGEETEMVEVLLNRGADPNLVLPEGIAAIHLAAGTEQESGVRCLGLILQFGGDPNVRSVDGLTPLHVAASWGCYTCLKLLLMEGGDPSLEDQDGNRAIDLATEQGNEMCVRILQQFPGESRQEPSPWMSHRRTESFLSTDAEPSEVGSWLSEDESRSSWLDGTLKESSEDAKPGGSSPHYRIAAAPTEHPWNCVPEDEMCCFGDCPSTSWPTEDSQGHGAFHNRCNPHAWPGASSSTLLSCSNIPGNQAPRLSSVRVPGDASPCPRSEVPVGTPQAPGFKNTTDEGRRSSPDPAAFQDGTSPDLSVNSPSSTLKWSPEVLSTTGPRGKRQTPLIRAIRDECEASVLETQDADTTLNLSQYKSFLGPDLMKVTGQEGLDVTSPDHAYVFSQLDSTAMLDLEKTVVDLAFLTRACGKPDGCRGEEQSFSESPDGRSSRSQYTSCDSECYESFSEAPSCYKAQKYGEREAGLVSSPCSWNNAQRNHLSSQISQDPHSGAAECHSGEHAKTQSVPAAGREVASPAKSEGTKQSCDGSCLREAFSKICAGKRSLDLHNTGQSECLGDVREPGLSRASQGDLLVKDPTDNWDFCTLPLRESQRLAVPDDPGEEGAAPVEAPASVTGKQDTVAKKQRGSNGATSGGASVELNADQGRRPAPGLSRSTQDVAKRDGDSGAEDTVLIRRESEETQPLPGGESAVTPAEDTVAVPPRALNVGEDETPELDVRMMMLATKACHSPLLQQDQRPCHVTPRSKGRMTSSSGHSSSSASLFDETLEMPRRPRRVRSPDGMPAAAASEGRSRGSSPCRMEEETGSLEDTELIAGSARSCQQASQQPSRPSGPTVDSLGAPTNSGRRICTNDTRSSREADVTLYICCHVGLEAKPPLIESPWPPREEMEEGPAQEGVDTVASCSELGKSCKKHSGSQRPPSRPRISFSRLSSRGPLGVPGCISPLPERWSPGRDSCHPGVPLSPGGRPVNLSASEPVEYLYVDEDRRHALVEWHVPSTDCSVAGTTSSEDTIIYDWRAFTKSQAAGQSGKENSPPRALPKLDHLSDEALVRKLRDFGVNPGPVTGLTRKVYVQLLEKLMSDPKSKARKGSAGYNLELSSALETYQIPDGKDDEMTLSRQFDQPDKNRKWREGVLKSSFNYLLLDPRVTQNLPFRSQYVSQAECFRTFISAIFYVGKGKRSRPYSHLYEALTHYKESRRKRGAKACPKVQHILEIWASGEGVISIHCFQNVIPVEAYTREASMVDAIGLKMLTNQKRGNYYGIVAGWSMKRRRNLGVYLLHRAMQIFLAEGERQLRPADIQ
ncbi:PREDICTED: ankyrin repeat and LEM domain-containing protein 1 [Gekko japonicus]|uniref:Ankyrin repeat and LEM domain-containing protein 1 n=1 Tax=Gekko japonicus TaxID=146911 RepID=A0ABM1L3S1_GEKJA|nr:PREDICTED: ankyrin repeat and LEM domain-containing protein 1 [Gekko japonicus]